ncbi:protein arginine N-methyltransferase 2 isoform X3 [Ictalurus furcatus]|uniref:protein arginine N-methyltransferase 2 isoform X3 n=1 Tax=Ictalurus furcatus TaxID=66913 RepID=UPI002350E588|nr:protein arginine N-methyltransferase 2 isoform X3 [Ictalurus furcatus]
MLEMSGSENTHTNSNIITQEFIALEDFNATGAEQLSFTAGDTLLVHEQVCTDWWWAERSGCFGYVPSAFLHRGVEDVEDAWQDEEYFSTYGTLLHLEMLSDRPRTETYRQVIVSNSAALRGKVVMDLGCGTGIISLFCGRLAQPAAVYAVEASSVAEHTEKLVKLNRCDDVVTVFRSRAEDLMLPSKVDVLVSEWMGNCLLFEFMVESVLRVRDRWLKDGGMMWPSSASLSLVPCQAHADYSQKMEFWENLYGLDFSCLQPVAQEEFFSKPKFSHQLDPADCLSTPCDVISLDMHTLSVSDLEKLSGEFRFTIERSGTLHGFTAWFSTFFHSLDEGGSSLELNTGPHAESTHWKQTLFMLDGPIGVEEGDCVGGAITLQRNPIWRRHMSITIEWRIKRRDDPTFCEVSLLKNVNMKCSVNISIVRFSLESL